MRPQTHVVEIFQYGWWNEFFKPIVGPLGRIHHVFQCGSEACADVEELARKESMKNLSIRVPLDVLDQVLTKIAASLGIA